MNIDELKLIVDLVKELSGSATSLAVWWIAGHYTLSLLKVLIICGTIVFAIKLAMQLISANMSWAEGARAVAKAYGAEGGTLFYSSDQQALRKAILQSLKGTKD